LKRTSILFFALGAGLLASAGLFFPNAASIPSPIQAPTSANSEDETLLKEFSELDPIDEHTHVLRSDPGLYALLEKLNLHVLDICVADDHSIFGPLSQELANARKFVAGSHGRAALCTTFDPFKFDQPHFSEDAIRQLNDDFAKGAVAVKIWKNIGMELKRPDGKYVMPDDPVFAPIYEDIAAHHKSLIAHLAEPSSCWQPPNPDSPDYEYYKENPEWFMYVHPDHPSKETILAARDRMLAENPHLRVIGAHLGSMETDVDLIAQHLDRYPNFAADMAARMEYLIIQPRAKVRNFLIKYQDRVIYGTDLDFRGNEKPSEVVKEWREAYARDWKFLATDEFLEYRGRKIEGLKLPPQVLKKIYHDNAVRWIPGVIASRK
jgi:predicted TIM-barrel fold metal-dependent hydrolase